MVAYYMALLFGIAIGILACAILAEAEKQFNAVKRDEARFRLFAARDRLYRAGFRGLIPIGSPAFIELRDALNSLNQGHERLNFDLLLQISQVKADRKSLSDKGIKTDEGQREQFSILLEAMTALLELFSINSIFAKVFIFSASKSQEPQLQQAAELQTARTALEQVHCAPHELEAALV